MRQMADLTPDTCRDCHAHVGTLLKYHGDHVCETCAQIRDEEADRYAGVLDCVDAMERMSRTSTSFRYAA